MIKQSSTDFVIIDEPTFLSLLSKRRPLAGHDEVQAMLEDIRPVLRFGDDYSFVDIDRMNVHYSNLNNGPIKSESIVLREHSRMLTLHRFTFGDRFEPYVTEVLAMLPLDLPDTVVAFEVTNPFGVDGGIDDQRVALNHGYHAAWTILYELA